MVIEKQERQEYETLVGLLEILEEGPVRRALINTWSNVERIWRTDGEMALNHHGKVLTAEERNRLQHTANGNIKDVTKRRGHQAMTVRPYERPKQQMVKKPTFWKNYYFEEGLEKIPYETKAEEEVRFYGWRWMVYASTMSLKPRTDGAKFNPLRPIEEQPGWCYLRLFKREYRDIIDWPSFPTLMEICSWEVELRDPDVLVGFVKPAGSSIWHIEARGHESWAHLEKYAKYIGHHIFGGDQNTYAAVAARAATRRLTRQDTRTLFNGMTPNGTKNRLSG